MAISAHGWELLALSTGALVANWVTGAIRTAIRAILYMVFHERVYSENCCKLGMNAVIERVSAQHIFSERREVVGTRMQPSGIVIGPSFIARVERIPASDRSVHSAAGMRVRVLRFRWMPPLVSDDAILNNAENSKPGVIRVLRQCGTGRNAKWAMRNEVASPASVPAVAAAVAGNLASKIASLHKTDSTAQVRVVLSGPPGCGKSTTARVVAKLLGAVLVPGFDPSRPGHNVGDVLTMRNMYAGEHTVISMDEFDMCIRRAITGEPHPADTDMGVPEVTDKASWNALMDMLQFVPSVTIVMSSNLTFPELDAMDPSGAMLRAGRVTHRIDVNGELTTQSSVDKSSAAKDKVRHRGQHRGRHMG